MGESWLFVTSAVIEYNWGDAGEGEIPFERIYLIQFGADSSRYEF